MGIKIGQLIKRKPPGQTCQEWMVEFEKRASMTGLECFSMMKRSQLYKYLDISTNEAHMPSALGTQEFSHAFD